MKLPGFCERCRRIRYVYVRVPTGRGVEVGICDECERAANVELENAARREGPR